MNSATILLCTTLLLSAAGLQAQETSGRHLSRPNPKQKGPSKPSTYTIAQFDGRWQETSRKSTKTGNDVAVEDTFYIRFYNGTRADSKEGRSMVVTGAAEVLKDDRITTSADDFKIIALSDNEMVLDDESGFIHTFNKKDMFVYELIPTPPQEQPDTAAVMVDLTGPYFIKSWFAYRRKANPGVITNQTAIIRDLKVISGADKNYKGEIEYSLGGRAIVKPCTINIADDHSATIATDGNSWNVVVSKCDGKELILGNKETVVYYFKNNN